MFLKPDMISIKDVFVSFIKRMQTIGLYTDILPLRTKPKLIICDLEIARDRGVGKCRRDIENPRLYIYAGY